MMSRSRTALVVCLAALVVFATPLLVVGAVTAVEPEIRLIRTDDRISALIVTERERMLLINSADRGVTRSAIGRVARPWEPSITTLIAPADDEGVVGLWEALRDPRIQQLIVVGVPGGNPLWSRIERDCAERGISLEYVTQRSHVELDGAGLTVDPHDMNISLGSRGVVIAIALASKPLTVAANVGVVNDFSSAPQDVDLIVTALYPETDVPLPFVTVGNRELVRLVVESSTVKVQGGRLHMNDSAAN